MKLLLDQNLSFRLVSALADIYPDARHVRDWGMADADDSVLWAFAKTNGYAIVSKDDDFRQRSLVFGHPPKIVWIRLGNCSTGQIEALLR